MKKHILCTTALLASSVAALNAATTPPDVLYGEINADSYYFELSIRGGIPTNQIAFLEISKDPDFTFVERAYPLDNRECTIKFSDIPEGEYYYRGSVYTKSQTAWCDFKVYPPNKETAIEIPIISNGTQSASAITYIPQQDTNQYTDVELADGTILNIESIWLRSSLNGSPLMPVTAPGLDPIKRTTGIYELIGTMDNYARTPFDSFSHGAIVKDGVIYIGVGASSLHHPLVTLESGNEVYAKEPDRVMIHRYDLSTGEFLKPIRLKDGNGNEFDHKNYRMMPWLRTDDAGTPYVLCAPLYGSFSALYEYADGVLTLDFSQIQEGTGATATLRAKPSTSSEELHLAKDETDYLFGTVSGDIADGNYRVWGMKYSRSINSTYTAEDWSTNLKVWDIKNRRAIDYFTPINIDRNPFTSESEAFVSYTPKVYPIDNTHVYTHATPALKPTNVDFNKYANYEPAFYTIDEQSATLSSCLSDAITADMPSAHETKRMSGFPIVKIGDATIAAYGHLSAQPDATAVQLIQLKDPEAGFTPGNIIPLWDLFNDTGLSDNLFQALDMTFVPASEWTSARSSDDTILGHLIVYAAGAGMGVYRISADEEGAITNIPNITVHENITIAGGMINVSSPVSNVNILDAQGRIIRHYDHLDAQSYPLPSLSPGLYILHTSAGSLKFNMN